MSKGGQSEKYNIGGRGSYGIGFADEATQQLLVVPFTKFVYLSCISSMHRRLSKRYTLTWKIC